MSLPQFNILQAQHKKMSCVTAEEPKAQHMSHATGRLPHVIRCMAGGVKKGGQQTRRGQRRHFAMSSDTKMRAARLGSQTPIRTRAPPAHEIGYVHYEHSKTLRKCIIIELLELAEKKILQNLLTTFTQTSKQETWIFLRNIYISRN